eukprot:PITA_32352
MGFAVAPKNLPIEKMICSIEDGINNLPVDEKEALRQEFSLIMRKAKTPKSNLSKEEQKAFKSLWSNDKIVVLKADKGGAAVILDKDDYVRKMNDHLKCGNYKKMNSNPIPKIMKDVKKIISDSNLDDKIKKKLIPSYESIPRTYGLPKIHKEGVPLRPIVNTIGSPTYELAKYVAKILKPLVGNTDSFIKDSQDFVNLIKNERIERDDILVSFDVVSLFTKIPLDEAIQGVFYEKTSGVAMGSPISPIVANLYMEYFEKKALESYPLKPAWWKRFVDDTNIKWTHGKPELDTFFIHLNSISPEIKFTMELEENMRIPFLEILIIRKEDGSLGHKVFRKSTHTESYLHAESHHHPAQKFGVLNTLSIRALRISDSEHLNEEKKHLVSTFKSIGYKKKEIKRAIEKAESKLLSYKPKAQDQPQGGKVFLPYIHGVTDKITKFLRKKNIITHFSAPGTIRQGLRSVKDDIDKHQLKGVYKIDCSCGKSYIGEIGHSLQTRLKEHGADIKNERSRTSALVEPSAKTKHHICLESASIIATEEQQQRRKIREALEIIKHPHNLNRDNGMEISRSWLPLIKESRSQTRPRYNR